VITVSISGRAHEFMPLGWIRELSEAKMQWAGFVYRAPSVFWFDKAFEARASIAEQVDAPEKLLETLVGTAGIKDWIDGEVFHPDGANAIALSKQRTVWLLESKASQTFHIHCAEVRAVATALASPQCWTAFVLNGEGRASALLSFLESIGNSARFGFDPYHHPTDDFTVPPAPPATCCR